MYSAPTNNNGKDCAWVNRILCISAISAIRNWIIQCKKGQGREASPRGAFPRARYPRILHRLRQAQALSQFPKQAHNAGCAGIAACAKYGAAQSASTPAGLPPVQGVAATASTHAPSPHLSAGGERC